MRAIFFVLAFIYQVSSIYDQIDLCTSNGWTIQPGLSNYCSTCDAISMFGGPSKFTSETILFKSYILPSHNAISISANFISSNQLSNSDFYVIADDQLLLKTNFNSFLQTSSCGNIYQAQIQNSFVHNFSSLTIYIYSKTTFSWWGITNFELDLSESTPSVVYGSETLIIDKVYQEFPEKTADQQNWTWFKIGSSPMLQSITTYTQNNLPLFGPYNIPSQTSLDKTFNFPQGSFYQILFKVIQNNIFKQNIEVFVQSESVLNSNSEGVIADKDSNFCFKTELVKTPILQHNNSTLEVFISFYPAPPKQYSSSTANFGVRDFQIIQYKVSEQIQQSNEIVDDDYQFDEMFIFMFRNSMGCLNYISGECHRCEDGWILNQYTCFPQCGDKVIKYNEECDDGNNIEFDGCHNCKFSCPLNCLICEFGQCIKCINQMPLIDNSCHISQINQLTDLKILNKEMIQSFIDMNYIQYIYELDNNNQQLDEYSIIQQLLLIEFKQNYFNDNSMNSLDQQTKYLCQKECLLCISGLCLQCLDGWNLNNFQCQSICGDGLLALNSNEQCDDGNYNQDDGCSFCQIQCSSNCFSCSYSSISNCNQCEQYYSFNELNICVPICGDGYLVKEHEECDDGNDIQFDGCFNCLIEQIEQCNYGYYLINNECQSKCGDQIIVQDEECDDGNQNEFDGCFKCKIWCFDNCINCQNGKCLICQQDYILNENNCQLCGNGQIDNLEQCDDGNIDSNDGCSKECKIEQDFNFLQIDQNIDCDTQPYIELNYVSQSFDIQQIQLKFTKKVKLEQFLSIEQLFNISIQVKDDQQNYNNVSHKIIYEPIIALSDSQYLDAKYLISIQFLEYPNQNSTFYLQLNQIIIDQCQFSIQTQEKLQTELAVVNYQQVQSAKTLQSSSSIFIKTLEAKILVAFFINNLASSAQILNLLQYYSFLRYINVVFPRNLEIFFQSYDLITIEPILNYFQFQHYYTKIINQQLLASYGKFLKYQINSELLNNLQSQIFQLICLAFLYFFLKPYRKFYFNFIFTQNLFNWLDQKNLRVLNFLFNILQKLSDQIFKLEELTALQGIQQLFFANFWDLSFSIFLFFETKKIIGAREIISYFLGILYILIIFTFIIKQVKRCKSKKEINLHIQQKYLEILVLIQQSLIILVITKFQFQVILQIILLILINSTYIALVIFVKFHSKLQFMISDILIELPVIAFTIVALIQSPLFKEYINEDQNIILGYIQIGFILFGFGFMIIKNLIEIINKFKLKIKKFIEQCKAKQIKNQQEKNEANNIEFI